MSCTRIAGLAKEALGSIEIGRGVHVGGQPIVIAEAIDPLGKDGLAF
jgi:hypothetical protein